MDWNHHRTLPFMYMLREIKEVVKRYILARLIKNSVNEAALSPQIEQMCMKQQCGNPLHQPWERVKRRWTRSSAHVCVRKVFCKHLILHNECSPLSSTHTDAAKNYTRELPLPVTSNPLPGPQTSPIVCAHVCVRVIDRGENVLLLTGKLEGLSCNLHSMYIWLFIRLLECLVPSCAMFRSTQGALFSWFSLALREC